MIKLGITGGIGSGKSYVSHLLRAKGIEVYDTDSEAKRLTLSHPQIRQELTALLGKDVYQNNILNKPLLANYLFACKENAQRINAIIHPRVYDDFVSWARMKEKAGASMVGMESAILFESGFNRAVDKVLFVYAPLDVRIRRAMERDKSTEEQVRVRMLAQASDEENRRKSDFLLINDGVRPLESQLEQLLQVLIQRKPIR